MKHLLLTLTIVVNTLSTTAQWTTINSGTLERLDAIHFKDAQNGMCSGGFTNALVTTDGGSTWTLSNDQGFRDYSFSDATNGYGASIVSQSMAKTSNGGTSWTSITPPTSNSLWGVAAISSTTAHFVGTGGVYWRTTNGGSTVTVGNSGTTALLTDIVFTSPTTGYLVSQSGEIKKTVNSGTNWTTVYSNPGAYLSEMCFVDANTGFVVGSAGQVFKTTDAGANWQVLTTNSSTSLKGVDFYDANHGIVVGLTGNVFYTNDGGNNWYAQVSGTSQHLYDVRMLSTTSALVTGDSGTILKNDNITTSLGIAATSLTQLIAYPNPVQDHLTIESSFPFTAVELHNTADQLLFTATGNWETHYMADLSQFEPGIYYVIVADDRRREILKIIKN